MPSHSELVTSKPVRLVIAEGHEIVLLGLERFLSSLEFADCIPVWEYCHRDQSHGPPACHFISSLFP